MDERQYIAIDMKSFYASVECVAMGYDPLKANLLVADSSRSDQTICLAVSPALKAIGVPSRPRLFEAKQAIRKYEQNHHTRIEYIMATPRMAEYERISALIYSIILRYASAEDVHVYSIDESFIDATPYLNFYKHQAAAEGISPARCMAITIIHDVLNKTGITATVGIGTNLYLAKVAMDIVAKKAPADKYGVRIAELNEETYCLLLWNHRPLTDFWMIGPGKARRLCNSYLFTMGDIAQKSQIDEEWFYKTFGIDGEILIAHAWGQDPVRISDIKNYRSSGKSMSNGQVLPRPYTYDEARLVFSEMIDTLCSDMFSKSALSSVFTWWVSYDYKSLEKCPEFDGPVCIDFYGRLHPKHNSGTVRMPEETNSILTAMPLLLDSFDKHTDHRLLYRKLGICADRIHTDNGFYQYNFFIDHKAYEREKNIQSVLVKVRSKFGSNAMFLGKNLLKGATQLERNMQIGGHKA